MFNARKELSGSDDGLGSGIVTSDGYGLSVSPYRSLEGQTMSIPDWVGVIVLSALLLFILADRISFRGGR
jgi:hypothetical protein